MATSQNPRVQLTRAQRDAIREHIECFVAVGTDFDRCFADAEFFTEGREWVRDFAWRLAVSVRLLDALDWEQAGSRDSYELEIDPEIAEFMRQVEAHARGAIEDNRQVLADGPSRYLSSEEDAENRGDTREMIDLDLDAIAAAHVVLKAVA